MLSQKSIRSFSIPLVVSIVFGALIFHWHPNRNAHAQSVGSDCREEIRYRGSTIDIGSEIPLTIAQTRHVTNSQNAIDGNAATAATMGVSPENTYGYLAVALPRRMAITQIELNWRPQGGGTAPGSIWNLYTGFGETIPEVGQYHCYIGEASRIGLNAEGRGIKYVVGKPFKADYFVLTQGVRGVPSHAEITEIKLWGWETEESSNTLYGRITDRTGQIQEGLNVILLKNGVFAGASVTSRNGYKFTGLTEGTYEIKVIASAKPSDPSLAEPSSSNTVTFAAKTGKQKRDIRVTPKPKKHAISITTHKASASEFFIGEEIQGLTLRVFKKGQNQSFAQGVSPAYFGDLDPGNYTIQIEGKDIEAIAYDVTVKADAHIPLKLKGTDECKPHPRPQLFPSIGEVRLCGEDANKMGQDPSFDNKFRNIDSGIQQLRSGFQMANLPLQVVIYSSAIENAIYDPIVLNHPTCPNPLKEGEGGSKIGEQIAFSSEFLKQKDDAGIFYTVVHEFGHGLDFRLGQCHTYRSLHSDFQQARNVVLKEKQRFNSIVRDGTYPNVPKGNGHPLDDPLETFASLFHACVSHPDEYNRRLAVLPPNVKTTYANLTNLVVGQCVR